MEIWHRPYVSMALLFDPVQHGYDVEINHFPPCRQIRQPAERMQTPRN